MFQNDDGSLFTYKQLHDGIQRLAVAAGLDPKSFRTHSCRIGGATTLAILGFPAHIIKQIGRWRSISYQLYTKASDAQLREVSRVMGREAGEGRNMFGELRVERACRVDWDDFSDVSLFPGSSSGSLACRWNS